ncbi:MAG TPA: Calx-beta domain-containing protein [Thermoanaerobaculia bacterium]|nr:Calx-beta domain-containing protein [Thermoanaerobaculia bacterium]
MPHDLRSARTAQGLLSVLAVAATLGMASSAVAQRPDDPGMLKFQGAAFPVDEGGLVTVVVKRLRGSTGAVEVSYETTPGSATEGDDYVATSGTLSWGDGDRSDKIFTVEILEDDLDEGQETFGVVLFDPTGGAELSPPSSAVVRIKPSDRADDDGEDGEGDDGEGDDGEGDDGEDEAGVIRLTAISFPAFESSMLAQVSVERVEGTDGEVGVDFTTMAGSATEGDDYTPAAGMLSWGDGEGGVKTFEVTLVDDDEEEGLETISVILSNPTGGAAIGDRDVGSIWVIDDDGGEGSCIPDATTLCLLGGGFQVTGTWRDFQGTTGDIQWIPSSDESGFGWFLTESNIELIVKMLDGCGLNERIWVFLAATTNLEYEVEITDLSDGTSKTYSNPLGEVAIAEADTDAFVCAP